MKRSFVCSIFIFSAVLTNGCKDQIVNPEAEIREVSKPTVCPPQYYGEPPALVFAGAQRIDSVSSNQFAVHWEEADAASAYLVYVAKRGEELKLFKAVDRGSSSLLVSGLEPLTEYQVAVKILDERGLHDLNDKLLNATTNSAAAYRNQKSLYFDGFASISLGSSKNVLPSQNFTLSLWFKTGHRQETSEGRLLTFHRGFSAGTAFSLGVKRGEVFLQYRDGEGNLSKLSHSFSYHDNSWHHLTATYNGRFLNFYLDGNKISAEVAALSGLGDHPARIGSYTGSQKGFTGLIDEVSIWTSAMSAFKVRDLYNSGQSTDLLQHARAISLRVWHRLGDDGQDSSVQLRDQMGNAHGDPLNIESDDFSLDSP